MALIDIQTQLHSDPTPEGMETGTGMLLPQQSTRHRLRHFSEEAYDLSDESHIVRFCKVLLGDVGAGQLRKRLTLARLQQTMQGSHFYDLDRFYGALFGIKRRMSEILGLNPYTENATAEEWMQEHAKDASYRSRIIQFARAISYGATPTGMELMAEAILSVDCDVYESFVQADASYQTYGEIEAQYATFGAMDGTSFGALEGSQLNRLSGDERREFTIRPKRTVTLEEKRDVLRVISRLKPADARAIVDEHGIAMHLPADIRQAKADSEFWQVVPKVVSKQTTTEPIYTRPNEQEQPAPVFAIYQGEAWMYNADIVGIAAYATNPPRLDPVKLAWAINARKTWNRPGGGPFTQEQADEWNRLPEAIKIWASQDHQVPPSYADVPNNFQRLTFKDGSYLDFLPELALASPQQILAGRAVSDGILVARHYSQPRMSRAPDASQQGSYAASPVQNNMLSQTFVDRIDLEKLASLFRVKAPGTDAVRRKMGDSFWVSHGHDHDSGWTEVLEVRLNEARRVNHISFQASHYPQKIEVEYWDESRARWRAVHNINIPDALPWFRPFAGQEAWQIQSGSSWAGFWNLYAYARGAGRFINHPWHHENWVSIKANFSAVNMRKFRIKMTRLPNRGPMTQYRNQKTGGTSLYQLANYTLAVKEIEVGYRVTSRDDVVWDEPIGTSIDMLGSAIVYEAREDPASGLLETAPKPWRSEPQPINQAVVNLYLDTRDADGDGTLVDRFYTDPLYPGPHLNLYYSNDVGEGEDFQAADDVLPVFAVGGSVVASPDDGLIFSDADPSWLQIENGQIHLDATKPWWMGFELSFAWPDTVAGSHTLFSMGGTTLILAEPDVEGRARLTFTTSGGDARWVETEFQQGNVITIICSYDPATGVKLVFRNNNIDLERTAEAPVLFPITATHPFLFFGSFTDTAGYTLKQFVLKQTALTDADQEGFIANPDVFNQKPYKAPDPDHTTDNALIRFSQNKVRFTEPRENVWGLVGGHQVNYERLIWEPIARDYVLSKGYMWVPPTKAMFWKMEFTNLVAEPYEAFMSITRKVRLPPFLNRASLSGRMGGGGYAGMRTAMSSNDAQQFKDSADRAGAEPTNDPDYSATEVMFSRDPGQRQTLRDRSWTHGFQAWHIGANAPMFPVAGRHLYQEFEIRHTDKIAFFVGLSDVKAYKIDYRTDDDTEVYKELFFDADNLQTPFTWEFDPNRMYTDPDDPSVDVLATSRVFQSRHNVVGLQFATQQSPPVQVVPNDDFRDPILIGYDWKNPESWHSYGDATLIYQPESHSVKVNRKAVAFSKPLSRPEGMVEPIPNPIFATRPGIVADEEAEASQFGGVESQLVVGSAAGQIWAAARVILNTDLTRPLLLQIVSPGGTVLAQRSQTGRQGEMKEWYVGYTIGSLEEGSSFRVRVIQTGKTDDSWSVDILSAFDEGIVWEFSNDGGTTFLPAYGIRNNAFGVLSFPQPGNQLVWRVRGLRPNMSINSLQIRPWYLGMVGARQTGPHRGPNVSTYDHYPPITDDPEFTTWTKPIPQQWFYAYKQLLALSATGAPIITVFRRFYGRTAEDTVAPVPTDGVSFSITTGRMAADTAGAVDTGTRRFVGSRTASDTVRTPTDEAAEGIIVATSFMSEPLRPPFGNHP